MAISTLSKIAVSLKFTLASQSMMNVWTYNVLELVGTPNAAQYGEAWWNHVKTNYRALAASAFGPTFVSVRVSELGNPTGEYGEFAIPSGEQTGTRASSADPDTLPVFLACGVRLSVPSRVTRPGQKRFAWLQQGDVSSQSVAGTYITALTTLMGTMTANMTLGAPAAGVVLVPNVVGLNADGTIRASQGISGFIIDTVATSQVSRRQGRGI
jgi:hypothetical protein